MTGKILNAALLALALIIAGCGGGGDDSSPAGNDGNGNNTGNNDNACTVTDKKNVVHALMNDVYYWYDEVPDVAPANYSNEAALLDALIQPEKNRGHVYSYLTTVAEETAFLNNAEYVGFGFSWGFDQNDDLYLMESFEGGPAYEAGMRRGDQVVAIDGASVASMSAQQIDAALGPNEAGHEVTFSVIHAEGDATPVDITVGKAEVEAPVVGTVAHDLGVNGDTTYIFFRSFVNPAFDQLDAAFAAMKDKKDTRLVLDLRYNGGGLVSVAQHLGSLIAGIDKEEKVIAKLQFNDRYSSMNVEHKLETLANSVDVTDLVVITTGGTASASEMIINGLEPFTDSIQVAIVGSTTYGKPVGQSRLDFDLVDESCTEDILRGVTFSVVNSVGTSDYYTGFTPGMVGGCEADDDVLHQLGDPAEASLASALHYLDNDYECEGESVAKARQAQAKMMSLQPEGNPFIRDGWDLLIGGAR